MKSEWVKTTARMEKAPRTCCRTGFCRTMENALGDTLANDHKKGFVEILVTDLATFKQRVVGVAYKKSASDRGVMLNYCPFCGKKILRSTVWAKAGGRKPLSKAS